MKKALVITVGTGRNGADIASSLLFSIKKQSPNYLVFLVSSISQETTLPFILKGLGKGESAEDIDVRVISTDVNDMEHLIAEFSMIIKNLLSNKGFSKQDISIDYTSGTKSMSVAIAYVAIKYEVDSISYIHGKRDSSGSVTPGSERLNALSPNEIQLERKIRDFKVLFNQYQFQAAIQVLKSGTIPYQRKNYISELSALAEGYDAWDKFNFSLANEKLESVGRPILKELNVLSEVGKHKARLKKKLISDKQTIEHAKDIYSNALRRSEEGKYDDAVARLYRMVEMLAQIEFEKIYGHPTGNVPPSVLSDKLKEDFAINFIEKEECYKIGAVKAYKALYDKKNLLGVMFHEREKDFLAILSARNNSILAHGNQPVSLSVFDKLNNLILALYDVKMITTYPTLM